MLQHHDFEAALVLRLPDGERHRRTQRDPAGAPRGLALGIGIGVALWVALGGLLLLF